MNLSRRRLGLLAAGSISASAVSRRSSAAGSAPVKIGTLTDRSGPYSDPAGVGEEVALRLAIEDFGGKALGKPIEVVVADHQNKPDIAGTFARRWFDVDGVTAIMPGGASPCALAVQGIARDQGKTTVVAGPSADSLYGAQCSPTGTHWSPDTYSMPRASALSAGEDLKKKWFLIVVDYVTGALVAANLADAVQKGGGTVVGTVKHPFGSSDFSSFLLTAAGSGADVIGLVSFGTDLTNLLKGAGEFGIAGQRKLVAPYVIYTDLLGVDIASIQGLRFADGFYWNLNDATRAFTERFQKVIGRPPGAGQGMTYVAATHYLQAVEKMGSTDGIIIGKAMRDMPVTSKFVANATVRPDGRVIYDLNLMAIKKTENSKNRFDLYDIIGSVPGAEVFRPIADGGCPFLK